MPTLLIGFKPDDLNPAHIEHIRQLAPHKTLLITDNKADIEAALPDIEIATGRFPHQFFAQAPQLKWYQGWGAGTNWLMHHPEVIDLDFVLTNTSGMHAIPISEHIFGFMLNFARGMYLSVRRQAEQDWQRPTEVFHLLDKTMLLVGVGAIGERTAHLAKAFGMRVIGLRRHPERSLPHVDHMLGPEALLTQLPQADFVVLTQPLTHETKNMFGPAEFKAMKKTAYFINIGRGGTVQEPALIRALQEGWLAGAGLDVFATEPLPPESPLWTMENVIITPHCSGSQPDYIGTAMGIFLDNLNRYVTDQPLRNVVDKKLGY
jgi:phosphoglycerate dehydrogenase-like enzyme